MALILFRRKFLGATKKRIFPQGHGFSHPIFEKHLLCLGKINRSINWSLAWIQVWVWVKVNGFCDPVYYEFKKKVKTMTISRWILCAQPNIKLFTFADKKEITLVWPGSNMHLSQTVDLEPNKISPEAHKWPPSRTVDISKPPLLWFWAQLALVGLIHPVGRDPSETSLLVGTPCLSRVCADSVL